MKFKKVVCGLLVGMLTVTGFVGVGSNSVLAKSNSNKMNNAYAKVVKQYYNLDKVGQSCLKEARALEQEFENLYTEDMDDTELDSLNEDFENRALEIENTIKLAAGKFTVKEAERRFKTNSKIAFDDVYDEFCNLNDTYLCTFENEFVVMTYNIEDVNKDGVKDLAVFINVGDKDSDYVECNYSALYTFNGEDVVYIGDIAGITEDNSIYALWNDNKVISVDFDKNGVINMEDIDFDDLEDYERLVYSAGITSSSANQIRKGVTYGTAYEIKDRIALAEERLEAVKAASEAAQTASEVNQ